MFAGIQKNAYSAAIEKAAKYRYFAAFRAVKTANLNYNANFDTKVSWCILEHHYGNFGAFYGSGAFLDT